ncbi:MAG: hypothetical protein WBM28_13995 [Burkholderiales bacterium]
MPGIVSAKHALEEFWHYRQSTGILREMMGGRVFPTTTGELERAMRSLTK